jgi:hypothetical protein
MMNRRTWIRTAASGITTFLFAAIAAGPKQAQAASRQLDAETLKVALRVGRPEDENFIDRTVEMMNEGELPRIIVYKSYLWARKKRKHKFQYFKRAVIVLAAREGITINN